MTLILPDDSFAHLHSSSANLYALCCTCTPSGSMSDPDSSCPFDLLDAAMRDPFLQQAFRQLDKRHLYGIIARVCRSWHHLSTTSNSSLTVSVSTRLNEERGLPDAAISFSKWLQRNIRNLTALDLTLDGPYFGWAETYVGAPGMLQTITSATQLCSLRINMSDWYLAESFAGVSSLTNLTSLALCSCELSVPTFSSLLALTQLRALDLRDMGVLVTEEEHHHLMPDLTSSLVNLTSLTLVPPGGWGDLEEVLACMVSLPKLVALDIRDTYIESDNLVDLLGGLPITGVDILLTDPGHVPEVAGWLQRCVPSTLRFLGVSYYPGSRPPLPELQRSQLVRLLSPLRSAGAQLQELELIRVELSEADSVRIITGLTQLTNLDLLCKFSDDGWALLEAAFAHLGVLGKERFSANHPGMSWFSAKASLRQL